MKKIVSFLFCMVTFAVLSASASPAPFQDDHPGIEASIQTCDLELNQDIAFEMSTYTLTCPAEVVSMRLVPSAPFGSKPMATNAQGYSNHILKCNWLPIKDPEPYRNSATGLRCSL